ncbi:hypothetical protein ACC734_38375, partial [Rhizobium ruizarguesonis]
IKAARCSDQTRQRFRSFAASGSYSRKLLRFHWAAPFGTFKGASHVVMVSHPDKVEKVIEDAASNK